MTLSNPKSPVIPEGQPRHILLRRCMTSHKNQEASLLLVCLLLVFLSLPAVSWQTKSTSRPVTKSLGPHSLFFWFILLFYLCDFWV